ncbi:MAG: cation:proton antiporter [Desulfobacterales bacterium]|nr:MAG: cation:proton antiporter [Desulfobacterales bacterium]
MDAVTQMIFMIATFLLPGALGEFIFSRTGIPDMIWLVVTGIVAGPVFNIIQPALFKPIIPFFGAVALVSILAGGGLKLRISEVAEAAPRAFLLAILGFVLTIVAYCLFAHVATRLGYLQPVGLPVWIMVGAILGGTSSLVIIPTMSGGNVEKHVAHLLEVESCMTDALCVVVAMVMIDLILKGSFNLGMPIQTLAMAVGIGIIVGVAGTVALLPLKAPLLGKPHAYTVFLAGFLVIYGMAQLLGGNGALSVLATALIIGNDKDILPRIFPNRFRGYRFVKNEAALEIHDQITFFIKSFFFFLIGLMFPTSPKMILLGLVFALAMLLFRIPAVAFALIGAKFRFHQQSLIAVAIPRGMAAGVLSALPMHYGVPGMENLSQGVFSAIVFSILIFTLGFSLVSRMKTKTPNF